MTSPKVCLTTLVALVVVACVVASSSGARRAPGGSPFTNSGVSLAGVTSSAVAWGDYDSDGRLDFVITGADSSKNPVARLYHNNGDGTFSVDSQANLTPLYDGAVAWGDYDSDGRLDLLIAGAINPHTAATTLYHNNGDGTFTPALNLPGVSGGSLAWGDYNSDGRPDILLTGFLLGSSASTPPVARIYRNNGGGSFTDIQANLTGVCYNSSAAWGDYDSDGKLDIVLTGYTGSKEIAKVYHNQGGGTFVDIHAHLIGVSGGCAVWGDYNSDGRLDLLLTGAHGDQQISRVYRGGGNGVFKDIQAHLAGFIWSSGGWGDYNSDGRPDILLTGVHGYANLVRVTKVYRSSGYGNLSAFSDIKAHLAGVEQGAAAWGDYNSDGRLDFLLAGNTGHGFVSRLYRNTSANANHAPGASANLTSVVTGNQVKLSWESATDSKTPSAGLSYNVRVGKTPGGSQVLSPAALPNGRRLLPELGNAQERRSLTLTGLHGGTYYWSVQAIDSSFAGSAFAAEQTFTVVSLPVLPG
ncbi:MAG: VCBS repeat-containing protein [Gaiellaceae bacterium]